MTTGPGYGGQDGRDGVEPGFAEMRAARFGGPRDDLDDDERASSVLGSSDPRRGDDDWLNHLLE